MKYIVGIILIWSTLFIEATFSVSNSPEMVIWACQGNDKLLDYKTAKNKINLSKYHLIIDLDSAKSIGECHSGKKQGTNFDLTGPSGKNVGSISVYEYSTSMDLIGLKDDFKKTIAERIWGYISYIFNISYNNLFNIFVVMLIYLLYRRYKITKKPKN